MRGGLLRLLEDPFKRLRSADEVAGTTMSRSLAFVVPLVLVQIRSAARPRGV
jgi:hypothetical protein